MDLLTADSPSGDRERSRVPRRPQTTPAVRGRPRTYLLRGLLRCGLCGRAMEGAWNNGRANYRCRPGTPGSTWSMERCATSSSGRTPSPPTSGRSWSASWRGRVSLSRKSTSPTSRPRWSPRAVTGD
ncbi:hypothetical protein FZ103_11620 [Streptomonospora sp. PA3]|nr:hypothetical protein [Streptomonospora sp. PA3]